MAFETAEPVLLSRSNDALATMPGSDLASLGDISVTDPATGEQIATVQDHSVESVIEAVSRADASGKEWAKTTPRRRSDVLHAAYAKLVENRDALALAQGFHEGTRS